MSENDISNDRSVLHAAAKLYLRGAMELAANKHVLEGPSSVGTDWVRHSSNMFTLRETEVPDWAIRLSLCRHELMALPEYGRFLAALQSDVTIARLLGTTIGSGWSAIGIYGDSIIHYLAYQFVRRCGSLRFDDSIFEQVFRELDADLHRSEFDYILVAPLFGLEAEQLPMRLTPTIEIVQLTDPEIVRCLNLGLSPAPIFSGVTLVGSGIGVRIPFRAQRQIGEIPKHEFARRVDKIERLLEQVEAVIHALRLFKDGDLPAPAAVIFSEQWPIQGMTQRLGATGTSLCNYKLKADEALEFQRFWNDLQNCGEKAIQAAIRRFGYAGERHRPEDKLVDLLIAAESLFLADTKSEVSYRLSVRFALFGGGSDYSRRELFDHMKKAYDVRSKIVHGGNSKKEIISPKLGKVPFPEFVNETRQLLRISLKKAIRMAAVNDPAFGRWENPLWDKS